MKRGVEEYSVNFLNVLHYRFMAENSIALLLILQGEVALTVEGEPPQRLQENQLQVVNSQQNWQLSGDKDNIVAIISVSPLWLPGHAEIPGRFAIKSEEHPGELAHIAGLIRRIAIRWLTQNRSTWQLESHRDLLEIFCILIRYFTASAPVTRPGELSPRICRAVMWIKEHYQQPVSLQQLADHLHITTAHLSRQFSAETGVNFRNFLTEIRFQHAVKEIALTTRPIGQIVSEQGFCSARRFSRLFQEKFRLQPHQWRRGLKSGAVKADYRQDLSPPETQQTRNLCSATLFSLLSRDNSAHAPAQDTDSQFTIAQQVSPAFNRPGKPLPSRRYIIIVGSTDELLKQHVQQQLYSLKASLPAFQVEISNPLTAIFARRHIHTDEHNPTWSPWSTLDLAFSFLKQAGIPPLLRLSLADENMRQLEAFINHNRLLLGEEYMQGWSFIIDPGIPLSEHATPRAICQLALLRRLLPRCQLGIVWYEDAPENAPLPAALLKQIDFIGYAIRPNIRDNSSRSPGLRPRENQQIIHQQLEGVMQYLRRQAAHCHIYLQTWSTLTGDTLMINGLFFRGALLMEMLLSLPDEVDRLGLWLNSEQQNEVSSDPGIENNSLSLFFSSSTRRPIFHIISMRERITGKAYDAGPGWVAARSEHHVCLLLLNPVTINPLLCAEEELLADYGKCLCVDLALEKPGVWRIKQRMFDQKNGALYHQYGLHPTRYDRDEETMRYINQRSEPTLSVRDERITHRWTTRLTLDINAVCLLELTRIAD